MSLTATEKETGEGGSKFRNLIPSRLCWAKLREKGKMREWYMLRKVFRVIAVKLRFDWEISLPVMQLIELVMNSFQIGSLSSGL